MENIIKRVLDNDWSSIESDIEKLAAEKVKAKIDNKKIEVLAQINNTTVDKMKEIMDIKDTNN